MKNLYIIVTGAVKNKKSEQALWDTLKEAGFAVLDIHDSPRIAQHEIAITNAAIAKVIKNRFENPSRKVKLICLMPSDDVLADRLLGFPEAYINRVIKETQLFALQNADYTIPSDNLEEAAEQILDIIRDLEGIY